MRKLEEEALKKEKGCFIDKFRVKEKKETWRYVAKYSWDENSASWRNAGQNCEQKVKHSKEINSLKDIKLCQRQKLDNGEKYQPQEIKDIEEEIVGPIYS